MKCEISEIGIRRISLMISALTFSYQIKLADLVCYSSSHISVPTIPISECSCACVRVCGRLMSEREDEISWCGVRE